SHGLDNYFVDHAKTAGKEIGGLESVDEHVAVMGGLSDRDSEFMLRDALTQPTDGAKEFSRMYKAWRRGDTAALWAGDARLRNEAPEIAARLVENRNVKWVSRIEAELKTGKPTAIVAGALHFSGPRSVIALLQKRGYEIEHNNDGLHAIAEKASTTQVDPKLAPETQKVGDYYASGMDEKTIDAQRTKPLEEEFKRIDAIKDRADLLKAIAHLHTIGVGAF